MMKALKYTMWASMAIFAYHFYLVKKTKNPEDKALHVFPLKMAKLVDWAIYDFKMIMTHPGMTKMLPDRMHIEGVTPPPMKVLVLNLNGLLVQQGYSLGEGVTIYKRPGLSMFLNRLSKMYEVCIFGMQE